MSADTWKTVLSLALAYLTGKRKITSAQADALREVISGGSAEDALVKLVELWLSSEMAKSDGETAPDSWRDKVDDSLNALEATSEEGAELWREVAQRVERVEAWIDSPKRPRPKTLAGT